MKIRGHCSVRELLVEASDKAAEFQARLTAFEPQTKGQEILHETALRQFNTFYEYQRARLYHVNRGIAPVLWYTIAVGAFLNIILICLFDLRPYAHWIIGGLTSFFLATLISATALLDHPFRGEIAVSPEAFQLVYDHLMKK